MKRILVDMTHITPEKLYNSLSIYIFRILDNIEEENVRNYVLFITKDLEPYIKNNYHNFEYILFDEKKHIKNKLIRTIVLSRQYKETANKSGCDILLVASDLYHYTCVKTKLKKVVVIHDLKIIKETCNSMAERIKVSILRKFYGRLMKSACAVVAISNYTKKDILQIYKNIEEKKVYVISNSVVLAKSSVKPKLLDENSKYILYVNTLQPYKNVITLIKAYAILKNEIKENLVIVGRTTQYWTQVIEPLLKQNDIMDRVIHLENISDNELRYVYENAELFVTSSLREGFGYTPIEAAICCCPVISTRCESLPDVTRNKVFYYNNPTDEAELCNLIRVVLHDRPDIEVLKSISDEFRSLYSGKAQIEQFENLFKRI